MMSSYPLIKPLPLPFPTLVLLHTCNNVKLSSTINGTSTGTPLFAGGPPQQLDRSDHVLASAAKSGPFSLDSVFKRCETCGGQGAIECPGCKGTGKNKKNGNIFERWKCFECQGFGLKSCPECGKGGLTPEQRGER